MNTTRVLKISLAWINITYVFCYLVLGLIPGLRVSILPYVLHLNVAGQIENIFTLSNFIISLILWNVVVALSVALAGILSNYIKS